MTILLVSLHVFVSLFLIAVILLQAGRGQGLSWGMMGGTPQSILGTKTASFFTRVTTICAFIFLFTCIGLNLVELHKSKSLMNLSNKKGQVDLAKIKEALDKIKKEPGKSVSATAATADKAVQAVAATQEGKVLETQKAVENAAIPVATESAKDIAIATENQKPAETKAAEKTEPQPKES